MMLKFKNDKERIAFLEDYSKGDTGRMNEELWHKIMNEYIKSYESILHLCDKGIVSEDDHPELCEKLLADIITTFESEVEE